MSAKSTFWSKQKSHKTDETMICTKCNGIEIKQTSTIGMIFVGFVILMFIPAVRVFGFIGFGIFAVLILSGYRPVMRDCLKCKAKGDKIVPVSDVKGKMLFETYHADKMAEVEKVVEVKNKTNDDIKAQRTKKIALKIAFYTIAGMVIFVTIVIISVPSKNTETTINQSPSDVETPITEEQKAKEDEARREKQRLVEEEKKASYKAKIVSMDEEPNKAYSLIAYTDSENDVLNAFGDLRTLNDYVCHAVFQELRGRLDEIEYEEVSLFIAGKDMAVNDVYGNPAKKDVALFQLNISRKDISKFNCENHPDVFVAVQYVAFLPVANRLLKNIVQDCKQKISERDFSKTKLCRFL